jgi:multiple antibiotic resistance protein
MNHWFDTRFFGEVFITLFVIIDPPGSIPLFLGLTSDRTPQMRRRLAGEATLVAFLVIVGFAVFGQLILSYLGISVAALQGAGGLLLLLVALELLTGRDQEHVTKENVNVALVPLGTPLLAGPGAIVTTIVFVQRAQNQIGSVLALSVGILAVCTVLWMFLRFSAVIIRIIRESGVTLLTRIAGLLLAAIAVQLVAESVIAFAKTG